MSSSVIVAVAGAVALGVLAGATLPAGSTGSANDDRASAATPRVAGSASDRAFSTQQFSADKPVAQQAPVAMAEASTGSHSQVPLAP